MSGKIIRSMLVAVLALVMTVNVATVFVSTATHTANSTAILAMEYSTTGS